MSRRMVLLVVAISLAVMFMATLFTTSAVGHPRYLRINKHSVVHDGGGWQK